MEYYNEHSGEEEGLFPEDWDENAVPEPEVEPEVEDVEEEDEPEGTVIAPTSTQILRKGLKSGKVQKLQTYLQSWDENLTADGVFGRVTKAVVTQFQEAVGIEADGVAGPETWQALFDYISSKGSSNADNSG